MLAVVLIEPFDGCGDAGIIDGSSASNTTFVASTLHSHRFSSSRINLS
jgi:hypothetical protein